MDQQPMMRLELLCVLALLLAAIPAGTSCTMSEKKMARLREESVVFEVTGASRVMDRVNVFGDPIGQDAARARSQEEAESKMRERIIFGAFQASGGSFTFSKPRVPSYTTVVKEDERKGNLYRTTIEVFVSRKSFGKGAPWPLTTHVYREALPRGGAVRATNATANRALAAFVQQAARTGHANPAGHRRLSGEIRAVITRQETLGNARVVEITGAVRFE